MSTYDETNASLPTIPTEQAQAVSTPITVVSPTAVYSASNISKAVTSPASRPDYSDPFKMYDYYMNSPELVASRENMKNIQSQILTLNQNLRNTMNTAEDKTWSMNAVRGMQKAASDKASLPLQALSEQLGVEQANYSTMLGRANDLYSIAQNERGKIQELIAQTGGKAKISYTDSFESALKKATKYIEGKSEKDSVKELYMKTFGSSGKGLSTKEMEKKLKKAFESNKAYDDKVKSLSLQKAQLELSKLKQSLNEGSPINVADLFPGNKTTGTSNSNSILNFLTNAGIDPSPLN